MLGCTDGCYREFSGIGGDLPHPQHGAAACIRTPPAGVQAACDYSADTTRNTVRSPRNDTTTARQLAAVLKYVRRHAG